MNISICITIIIIIIMIMIVSIVIIIVDLTCVHSPGSRANKNTAARMLI